MIESPDESLPLPTLEAVHVNHGLHPDADAWAESCQRWCTDRDIHCRLHAVDATKALGESPESAARTARYEVFADVVDANDVLFLGHHADDQAETILFRLLRGAGPTGLAGMPRERSLGLGRLVRPLLGVTRDRLTEWAASAELQFIDDPSNNDDRFDRNYLRHRVMPVIEKRWPGYRDAMLRAAELQQLTVAAVQEQPLSRVTSGLGDEGLSIQPEKSVDQLAGDLHRWLTLDGWQVPPRRRIREFARQLLAAEIDRQPELALTAGVLRYWRGVVYRLRKSSTVEAYSESLSFPEAVVAGKDCVGPWGTLIWRPVRHGVAGIPTGLELSIRQRTQGLRLAPLGRPSRPFSQLCQEQDVPPWWRDSLPILYWRDQPLAIPGITGLSGLENIGDSFSGSTSSEGMLEQKMLVSARWIPPEPHS